MKRAGVYQTLDKESTARLEGALTVSPLFRLARWNNGYDRVRYAGSDYHTLSIYMSGYENVVRRDLKMQGVDDSFCLMPSGALSDWQVNGPIRFSHIYFTDQSVRTVAEKVFDRDGIFWEPPEITYREDPQLILLSQWLLHADLALMEEEPLLAEQSVTTLMTYLLHHVFGSPVRPAVRGGLSDRNRKSVTEYIRAGYHRQVTLKEMADLAGLSEFHFQRMFKLSCGMTPHEYLNRVRIAESEQLLRGDLPLSRIAQETGFSSQAHFTRVFRKFTGRTPGQYRKQLLF